MQVRVSKQNTHKCRENKEKVKEKDITYQSPISDNSIQKQQSTMLKITKHHQRLMDKLFIKFELKTMEDWMKISREKIATNGGTSLILHYKRDLTALLTTIYPYYPWELECVYRRGRDKSIEYQQYFMDKLFYELKLNSLEDLLFISTEEIKQNGGVKILIYYHNQIKELLQTVYPNYPWHSNDNFQITKRSKKIYFQKVENQRKFMDELFIKFKLKSIEDWINVSKKIIERNGGKILFSFYDGNKISLLSSIYPNVDWQSLKQKKKENFKSIENQRKFMDKLFIKFNLKSINDWNNISRNQIIQNGGKKLLKNFKNCRRKLLSEVYPNYPWKSKFKNLKLIENQQDFMDDLFIKLNLNSLDDFLTIDKRNLILNGGRLLLKLNENNNENILTSIYPHYPWSFEYKESLEYFPLSIENQKEFMDKLFIKFKLKSVNDWIHISKKRIIRNGGNKILLQYNNNKIQLLSAIYPNNDWRYLLKFKLKQGRKEFIQSIENQRKIMDKLFIKLNLNSIEDWVNVPRNKIIQNGGKRLIRYYKNDTKELLTKIYPNYPWHLILILNSKTLQYQRHFMNQLFIKLQLKTLDDWLIISLHKIRLLNSEFYNKDLKLLLKTIYPNFPWDFSILENELNQKNNFKLINYQREFMDELYRKFKLTSLKDWLNIKKNFLSSSGGKLLLKKYKKNFLALLTTIYPYYPWNFISSRKRKEYFQNEINQRKFMDKLFIKFNLKSLEDWLNIPLKKIAQNGGKQLILLYENNLIKLLSGVYRHYNWESLLKYKSIQSRKDQSIENQKLFIEQISFLSLNFPNYPWEFLNIILNAKILQNHRRLMDNLFIKKNLITFDDWFNISTDKFQLLNSEYYNNDLSFLLLTIYPNYPWDFSLLNNNRKFINNWKSIKSQRKFMDELFIKFNLKSMNDWLIFPINQIKKCGGKKLVKYYKNDKILLLSSIYSNYPWNFQFNENISRYELTPKIKELIIKYNINQKKDWYRLPVGENTENDIYKLLKQFYTSEKWKKLDFITRKKKSSQRLLFSLIQKIFPSLLVIEDYIHPYFIKTNNNMELDIFIPALQLAFEYQGQHHYDDIPAIFYPIDSTIIRDEVKDGLAKKYSIKIIYIPFWWDQSLSSLERAILSAQQISTINNFNENINTVDNIIINTNDNNINNHLNYINNNINNINNNNNNNNIESQSKDNIRKNENKKKDFNILHNQREFMDHLYIQFNLKTFDDWYEFSRNKMRKNGGNNLVNIYNGEKMELLSNIYPNYPWDLTNLNVRSSNFFKLIKNQRKFMDHLFKKFNLKNFDDWINIKNYKIKENGGVLLLEFYEKDYSKLLQTIYPNYPWNFQLNEIKKKSYFKTIDYQRKFMDKLYKKFNFKSFDDWIKYSKKFKLNEGKSLLRKYYFDNYSQLLSSIYPNYPWEFPNNNLKKSKKIFKKISNQRLYMDDLFIKLNLNSLDDWLNISPRKIWLFKSEYYEKNIQFLLTTIYPNYAWDFSILDKKNAQIEYFKSIEIQQKFMDELFIKFNLKSLYDWINISRKQIKRNGGRKLVKYYKSDKKSLLRTIYPNFPWDFKVELLYRFELSPKIKEWIDKYKITQKKDWYRIPIFNHIFNALNRFYPSEKWKKSNFAIRNKKTTQRLLFSFTQKIFPSLLIFENYFHPKLLGVVNTKFELDIFIPSLQLALEYQGEQHYNDIAKWYGNILELMQNRDEAKEKLAKKQSIKIIYIPYWWDNSFSTLQNEIHTKILHLCNRENMIKEMDNNNNNNNNNNNINNNNKLNINSKVEESNAENELKYLIDSKKKSDLKTLQNQREFMDKLYDKYQLNNLDDCLNVGYKFKKEDGKFLCSNYYNNDFSHLLSSIYPNFGWEFSKTKLLSKKNFKTMKEQRSFMNHLFIKYNLKELDDWLNNIRNSIKIIQQNGGKELLKIYKQNFQLLLSNIYPAHDWNFSNLIFKTSQNYFKSSIDNQHYFMENLFIKLNLKSLDEWLSIKRIKIISNGGRTLIEMYENLFSLLSNLYPHFPWEFKSKSLSIMKEKKLKIKRRKKISKLESIEYQREIMDKLFIKLKLKSIDDWVDVKKKEMKKNGARYLLQFYQGSKFQLLSEIYENHQWNFTENSQKKKLILQRKKMDKLFRKLKLKTLDDWLNLNDKKIHLISPLFSSSSSSLLSLGDDQYKKNFAKFLSNIYPNYCWDFTPLQFHFKTFENQIEYFDQLFIKLKLNSLDDWMNISIKIIKNNGGKKLLKNYQNNLQLLFTSIYPDHHFQYRNNENEKQKQDGKQKNSLLLARDLSQGDNKKIMKRLQREMDKLFKKFQIEHFEDWKRISISKIIQFASKKLINIIKSQYQKEMKFLLPSIYPNYPWHFPHPHLKILKRYIDKYNINQKKDWYRLPYSSHFNIFQMLKLFYPSEKWKKSNFQYRSKKTIQRLLFASSQKIFPSLLIFENYFHPQLISTEKNHYELDIFIPALQLAMEYQGEQHYDDTHGAFGPSSLEMTQHRDREKERLLLHLSINIKYIPYWWDSNLFSLQKILNYKM